MADRDAQVTCLRVSKPFFELAGKHIYQTISIDRKTGPYSIFEGWDAPAPQASTVSRPDNAINYKRRLLELTGTVIIRDHKAYHSTCCAWIGTEATHTAVNAKRLLVVWPAYIQLKCLRPSPIHWGFGCSTITAFNQCSAITIHNIEAMAWRGLQKRSSITPGGIDLANHERLTLVLQPVESCLSHWNIETLISYLGAATASVGSIRIIFVISEAELLSSESQLCGIDLMVSFLARFILQVLGTFDIFVFDHHASDSFQAESMREQLMVAIEVLFLDPRYQDRCRGQPKIGLIAGVKEYFQHHRPNPPELLHEWSAGYERQIENDAALIALSEEGEVVVGVTAQP